MATRMYIHLNDDTATVEEQNKFAADFLMLENREEAERVIETAESLKQDGTDASQLQAYRLLKSYPEADELDDFRRYGLGRITQAFGAYVEDQGQEWWGGSLEGPGHADALLQRMQRLDPRLGGQLALIARTPNVVVSWS
jgi:hypothetical protein